MSDLYQKMEVSATTSDSHDAWIDRTARLFAEWVHTIDATASAQIDHNEDDILRDVCDTLMGLPSNPSASEFATFERWLPIMQLLGILEGRTTASASILFVNDTESPVFMIKCCNQMAGKRLLFITRDGKLGLGPCNMSAGDRVALSRGVAVLMIIRNSGEEAGTLDDRTFEVVLDWDYG